MKFCLLALLCFWVTICPGQANLEECKQKLVPTPKEAKFGGLPPDTPFDGKSTNTEIVPTAASISGSVNNFAFDLLRSLQSVDEKSNVVASPLSISLLFSLLYDGAKPFSETKQEIGSGMRYESNQCHTLLLRDTANGFGGGGDGNELAQGSKIFVDKSAKPKKNFGAGESIEVVDFSKPAEVVKIINAFVSDVTSGVITNAVEEGSINRNDIMSVVNALFFKGQWASKFDPSLTDEGPFTTGEGKVKQVPFMQQDGEFKFSRRMEGAYLEMPYIGGRFVMNLFKPTGSQGLVEYLQGLNANKFGDLMRNARKTEVMVRLPKFEVEATYNLHEIFPSKPFNMRKLFTPEAELSEIVSEGAFVGSAVHKAKIIVDEEGTTAAAVTEARVQPLSAPPSFDANAPFVYFITDTQNDGLILFMGTVMDP